MYKPNYSISNNLLKYIGRIEACKEIITNAPLVPAWEARFREEAAVRSVHHGTHLEGNEITKDQAEKLMRLDVGQDEEAGKVAQEAGIYARHRDVQEIINYRSVLEWIDTHAADGRGFALFTEETLKKLHELVVDKLEPENSASTPVFSQPLPVSQSTNFYRTQQVIVRSVESGEVAFRPPVAIDVPFLIQEFFTWLNSREAQDIHPVIRAGIVHYELVRIHPFIDGNGRTARALALLILYSEGYDIKRFFSLEEYFDKDIQEYYRAILSVQASETQNMTYWLEYFSYGLAIELDRVKEQVLKLSQDLKLKQKLGTQVALSERQIILLEILQRQNQITTAEANEALPMISTDTILRDVKDLIEKGIMKKEGVTKGVVYTLVD
ncbi:MAG: Fic family protein [Patescibacteria group bacterium]